MREVEAMIIGTLLQPTEFRNWKTSFKSEVCQSSQYPRAAMLWIGEVEDAESIVELFTSASRTGRPIPDFENLDFKMASRRMEIAIRKLEKTCHQSRRQSFLREEITHGQTDCLDDPRLLQN